MYFVCELSLPMRPGARRQLAYIRSLVVLADFPALATERLVPSAATSVLREAGGDPDENHERVMSAKPL